MLFCHTAALRGMFAYQSHRDLLDAVCDLEQRYFERASVAS